MDMNEIKKKLIDLFANHPTAEIEQNSGKLLTDSMGLEVNQYSQLNKNPAFNYYFEILKELQDNLDVVLEGEEDSQQVKECLRWLNMKKEAAERNENREYFELGIELVRRGIYSGNWDEEQRSYFDTGIEMMKEWKDFFLSYTNRNFHETNNDFKEIISCVLEPDIYKENKDNSNCAARLIFHYLDQHNLKCFFDKRSMKCGDILKEKIIKHCTSVYVFVQLVEMAAFKYREDETNWCFEEFKEFDRWIKKKDQDHYKRYQFVLTDGVNEVFPVKLHGSYEKWRDKIKERVYIENLGGLGLKQVRKKMGELATEISETRKQILEDYYS